MSARQHPGHASRRILLVRRWRFLRCRLGVTVQRLAPVELGTQAECHVRAHAQVTESKRLSWCERGASSQSLEDSVRSRVSNARHPEGRSIRHPHGDSLADNWTRRYSRSIDFGDAGGRSGSSRNADYVDRAPAPPAGGASRLARPICVRGDGSAPAAARDDQARAW